MQSLHEWFLNCLGHNKSLAWASLKKGIATDNINESDFSCLASFWSGVPSTSLQLWGTRHEARWNPALPRHDILCAWCLKDVQQCKQSPCSKQHYSGPAQGCTIIIITVPYANILLLVVRLVPAKLNLQILISVDSDLSVRPQNLKLNLHNDERFSSTFNYHARPSCCYMHKNKYAGNVIHVYAQHKIEYTQG